MTEKIITYAIIGAIVGLTMSYLKKGAGEKVDSSYNGHFLQMNKFYAVLGVVTIVLGPHTITGSYVLLTRSGLPVVLPQSLPEV